MALFHLLFVAIIAISTADAIEGHGSAIQRVIARTQSAPPAFAGSVHASPRFGPTRQEDQLSDTSSRYSDARSGPDTEEQVSPHSELLTPPRSPPSVPSSTRSKEHAQSSYTEEWPSLVPHAIVSPRKYVPARQTSATALNENGEIIFTRPPYGWSEGEENSDLPPLTLAQRYTKLSARLILFEDDLRFLKSFTDEYDEQDGSPKMSAPLAYVETFPVGRRHREYVRTYVADGTHIGGHLVWILAHATGHLSRDTLRSKAKLLKRMYPELTRRIDNKSLFDVDEADAIGRYGEDGDSSDSPLHPSSSPPSTPPMHSDIPLHSNSPMQPLSPMRQGEHPAVAEEEQVKEIDGPIKPSKNHVSLEIPPLADMIKFFPPLRSTAIHVDNNDIPWLGQPNPASHNIPEEYKAPSRVSLPTRSNLDSSMSPNTSSQNPVKGVSFPSSGPGEPSSTRDEITRQTSRPRVQGAEQTSPSSNADSKTHQHLTEKEWWDEWHYKTSAMKRIEEYLFLFPDYLRQYKEKKIERHRYLPLRSSGPMIIPGLLQSEWFVGEDRLPKQYLFANLFIDGTPIWINVLSDCPPWRRDDREKRLEKLSAKYPHIATTLRHIHEQACQRKNFPFHPSWRARARQNMLAQAAEPAAATRALADYRYSKVRPEAHGSHTTPLTSSVYLPRWPARVSTDASSSSSAQPSKDSQVQDVGLESEKEPVKAEDATSSSGHRQNRQEENGTPFEKRATLKPSSSTAAPPVVTYLQIGSRWFAYPADRKVSPERIGTGVYFNPHVTPNEVKGEDDGRRRGILGKAPVEALRPSQELDDSRDSPSGAKIDEATLEQREDKEEKTEEKTAKESANAEKLNARRKKLAELAKIPENKQLLATLEACGAFTSPRNFAEALKCGRKEREQVREDIWREMRKIYGVDRQLAYWKQMEELYKSEATGDASPSSPEARVPESFAPTLSKAEPSTPYKPSTRYNLDPQTILTPSTQSADSPLLNKNGVLLPDSPPYLPSRSVLSPDSPPFVPSTSITSQFSPTARQSSMMYSRRHGTRSSSGSPLSPASDDCDSLEKSPLAAWRGPQSKAAADFYQEAVRAAKHTELIPVSLDATPSISNAKLAWRRRKATQKRKAKKMAASRQAVSGDDKQMFSSVGDNLPNDPFDQARLDATSRGLTKYRDAFAPRKSDEPLLRAKTPSAIY